MGKPYFSNQALGTGGCTCVFCSVAGRPLAQMKCFSGTKSPERVLDFHCEGCWSCSAARSSSVATGGGEAFFGGGPGGATKRFPNWMAFHQIEMEEMKRKIPAAISATRS